MSEQSQQQRLHETIEDALIELGELDNGRVVTGWIVVFETSSLDDRPARCGHFYGPSEIPTWRALGMLEWARQFGLKPDRGGAE